MLSYVVNFIIVSSGNATYERIENLDPLSLKHCSLPRTAVSGTAVIVVEIKALKSSLAFSFTVFRMRKYKK